MNAMYLKLYIKLQNLWNSEQGQELAEYGLVVALIAFGCTASMRNLAGGVNTAFSKISTHLASDV
ncbi:MAG: Flp family type IVb pilin [Terracidiphilus sp.]|jgi:Flp pilus assembly pilin Flp